MRQIVIGKGKYVESVCWEGEYAKVSFRGWGECAKIVIGEGKYAKSVIREGEYAKASYKRKDMPN